VSALNCSFRPKMGSRGASSTAEKSDMVGSCWKVASKGNIEWNDPGLPGILPGVFECFGPPSFADGGLSARVALE